MITGKGGKLAVIGSSQMITDSYINMEHNSVIMQVIISFLVMNNIQLNQIDADDPDVTDYTLVPSLSDMAGKPRVCLQRPVLVSANYSIFILQ